MGNAHCTVVNNTDKVIDVQTFNRSDVVCDVPYRTYSIPPGESIKVKAARTIPRRGIKVGVIFNQWASGSFSGSGPGCKMMIYWVQQGKELVIDSLHKNYREEMDDLDLKPSQVDPFTFVLCQGHQQIEKHGELWFKRASYSWL